MSAINISIIITTYNRPDALRLVLLALEDQSDKNFEVIIADDGSRADTRSMVDTLKPELSYSLKYVWQEDQGFQAAKIRNKAAAMASGNYLIFLDGDCVPPQWFVAKHRNLAEMGYYIMGNRLLLNEPYTMQVTTQQLPIWRLSRLQWLVNTIKGYCNRWSPLVNVPFNFWRKYRPTQWKGVHTCNLALWKQDLLAVNGFNEAFVGWGYEDSDFIIRLMRTGVRRKEGRFAAPVFHLWHKQNDRSHERENFQALQNVLQKENIIKASQGIDRYL